MKFRLQLKSLITAQYAGEALIDSLVRRFPYHDRDSWLEKIASGLVLVNASVGEPGQVLQLGEEVQFDIPDFYEPDLDTDYRKIWENENLILVSKPANLPVHSNHRFFFQNMTALLRRDENLPELNPMHRLDRETSGLMLFMKQKFKQKRLRRNPNMIIAEKFYLAVVSGVLTNDYLCVDMPLKEAGCPPVAYKMLPDVSGKASKTEFYSLGTCNNNSLLLARLGSGRKHQIRAHLAYAGFPVVGDKLYSHDSLYFLKRCKDDLQADDLLKLGAPHQLLHAYSLALDLPDENRKIFYSSFFSDAFLSYLETFDGWQGRADAIISKCSADGCDKSLSGEC